MSLSIISGVLLLIYYGFYLVRYIIMNFEQLIHIIMYIDWLPYRLSVILHYLFMIIVAIMLIAKQPKKNMKIFWLLAAISQIANELILFIMTLLKVIYMNFTLNVFICMLTVTYILMYVNHFLNEKQLKKTWYLPTISLLALFIYNLVNYIKNKTLFSSSTLLWIALFILLISGVTLYGYCMAYGLLDQTVSAKSANSQMKENMQNRSNISSDIRKPIVTPSQSLSNLPGYHNLAIHIVLLLFTFGIWELIWIYKTTDYLNCLEDEEYRNPTTKLLLCIFVPFYFIYWNYKSAQRIDKLAYRKGVQSELTTICLVLSFIILIVPPILMQEKINSIIENEVFNSGSASLATEPYHESAVINSVPAYSAPVRSVPMNTVVSTADELLKYKQLLDSGAITQQEFNVMKGRLLGMEPEETEEQKIAKALKF